MVYRIIVCHLNSKPTPLARRDKAHIYSEKSENTKRTHHLTENKQSPPKI